MHVLHKFCGFKINTPAFCLDRSSLHLLLLKSFLSCLNEHLRRWKRGNNLSKESMLRERQFDSTLQIDPPIVFILFYHTLYFVCCFHSSSTKTHVMSRNLFSPSSFLLFLKRSVPTSQIKLSQNILIKVCFRKQKRLLQKLISAKLFFAAAHHCCWCCHHCCCWCCCWCCCCFAVSFDNENFVNRNHCQLRWKVFWVAPEDFSRCRCATTSQSINRTRD